MSEIETVLAEIEQLPHYEAGPSATDAQIARLENLAGITVPADYKAFLKRASYTTWLGKWVYGVFEQESPIRVLKDGCDFDAYRRTVEARIDSGRQSEEKLPERAIVVSDDGAGGVFLLRDARAPDNGRVEWYAFEDASGPILEWASFTAFMEQFLADTRALGNASDDEPAGRPPL